MSPDTLAREQPRDEAVIARYQRGRREAWARSRGTLWLMLAAFAVFGYEAATGAFPSREPPVLALVAFGVAAACIVRLTFVANGALRCPYCGRLPMHSSAGNRGLLLDPHECPSCGRRLK